MAQFRSQLRGMSAEFVDLDVTTIEGANENLLSVFQFVEQLGFSFVVTPTAQGQFTGLYRRNSRNLAGSSVCLRLQGGDMDRDLELHR